MNNKKTHSGKLNISNISKNYKNHTVLNDISFYVNSGECVAILGMNGSGKTTLFNIIAGELKPSTGDVSISNDDSPIKSNYLKRIGYIPQDNPLLEDLSAKDNLRLWYCDSSLDMNEEISTGVLKALGIDAFLNKKVKHLSGGIKKRLSIGISLANSPDFLILDEPSAALDLVAKDTIHEYLKTFKANGGGILIATHDENELDMCDKLFLLSNGNLTEIDKNIRGNELINLLK